MATHTTKNRSIAFLLRLSALLFPFFAFVTTTQAQRVAFNEETAQTTDVIDFENVAPGSNLEVGPLFSGGSFGPITLISRSPLSVFGVPTILDSACPGDVCSGDEYDLGTPNETFGGPGRGIGGEKGQLYANDSGQGHVFIFHDTRVSGLDDPNSTNAPALHILNFPHPITIHSITAVDIDEDDFVIFRLCSAPVCDRFAEDSNMTPFRAPVTGKNGKAVVITDAGDMGKGTPGVVSMTIRTQGSVALDDITFSIEQESAPASSLTAYPNPFNPSTTIRFSIEEQGYVQLMVYDVLGREVRRLVDSVQDSGSHEVTFSSGDLPSGTYLYRLETPDGALTQRMLLLK